MPKLVIYYFGCGLLRSTIHSLWWALKKSTFLSDGFHFVNHTCHAGFHPRSHNACDGRNTVSHEQRNCQLVLLKPSIRGCSRDFYIAPLGYHVMIRNFQAKVKSASGQEMGMEFFSNEKNLQHWYFKKFKFSCLCC